MLRSERRHDGSEVSQVMSIDSLAALPEVDVDAVYVFLDVLSPRRR